MSIIDQIFDQTTTFDDQAKIDPVHANKQTISQVLQRSSSKESLANPLIATKIGMFFEQIASLSRSLTASAEIRNLLIDLFQNHATNPRVVASIAAAINVAISNHSETKFLYSVPQVASALLSVLKDPAMTPATVAVVGLVMVSICYNNPTGQRAFFSDQDCVPVIVEALKNHSSSTRLVIWRLGQVILQIVNGNPESRRAFSEHAAVIVDAARKYTNPRLDDLDALVSAIKILMIENPEGRTLFVSAISESLKSDPCPTPQSIENLLYVLTLLSDEFEVRLELRSNQAASSLMHTLAFNATTPNAVRYASTVIGRVAFTDSLDRRLSFDGREAVAVITSALQYATTPDCVEAISYAIAGFTYQNDVNLKLFATVAFVEEFRKLRRFETLWSFDDDQFHTTLRNLIEDLEITSRIPEDEMQ